MSGEVAKSLLARASLLAAYYVVFLRVARRGCGAKRLRWIWTLHKYLRFISGHTSGQLQLRESSADFRCCISGGAGRHLAEFPGYVGVPETDKRFP